MGLGGWLPHIPVEAPVQAQLETSNGPAGWAETATSAVQNRLSLGCRGVCNARAAKVDSPAMVGRTLGHYRLVEQVGQGAWRPCIVPVTCPWIATAP